MTTKQDTTRGARALKRLGIAAGATAALGAATFAHGVSELTKFRLKRYELPILPEGAEPFTILHVADLHMIPGQNTKIAWVSALDALNPDLVVNTGDNLSDARAVPDVLAALGPLLDRPGVFVFGTNDYWAPRLVNPVKYLLDQKREPSYVDLPWKGMRAAFIERGWRDATHQRLEFKVGGLRLAVTGTDDAHHDLDDYDSVAGAPNPDADLALGVTHAPYRRVLDRFAADGYALTLAGHTHGGQICLPGERALVTNADIDRERASGLHRYGDMWLEVSNGLGTSKFAPVRIFCRPSAALLTLTARDS
ncbi:metallophosphoesterase [Corynebacterium sp. p3-SID1145]|uniref:metallophosphoesterase n=1 Tax=unclassified Corynebacterium TaxID=2624378 RepID=UPI0021A9C6B4|nr:MULTISPECIES: metallophosphoesterase [unclassified Corynebacterium]MCT1451655.1 metallophosphoesterase [Corynebacterium sp. p3-SID1145]MCT1460752.1 metallophosphoesterase [Corynebacterium sp. p3-SID1140]